MTVPVSHKWQACRAELFCAQATLQRARADAASQLASEGVCPVLSRALTMTLANNAFLEWQVRLVLVLDELRRADQFASLVNIPPP
jgi:hypothetical protein